MKDRQNSFPEQGMQSPPTWCSAICRNAMNEVCVENCAIKRDCSHFEPKANLDLSNMPRFPLKDTAQMSREERFTAVTVYLAKVVDYLRGDVQPVADPRKLRAHEAVADLAASIRRNGNVYNRSTSKEDNPTGKENE